MKKCANVETIIGVFQYENISLMPSFLSQMFELILLVECFIKVENLSVKLQSCQQRRGYYTEESNLESIHITLKKMVRKK